MTQLMPIESISKIKGIEVSDSDLQKYIAVYNKNPQLLFFLGKSPDWLHEASFGVSNTFVNIFFSAIREKK